MKGTNANGAMPNRQHTSATPSPRATYTPTFQNKGQIWKPMVSQLELPQFPQEEGGQVQCFGDLIPMEGTNAKWCHAKSAAYVRDAKPEGDVHSKLPHGLFTFSQTALHLPPGRFQRQQIGKNVV